jgi:pimeloyl-ACP methyl ester carboxylesterase
MKLPLVALSLLIAAVPVLGHAQAADSAAASVAPLPQQVSFQSGGITLSGTLLVPRSPAFAVVLVHGSGRELRMLWVARWLATRGVAVLTYDKRGVGQSGGVYAGPEVGTNNVDPGNLELLAGDAAAAVGELSRRLPSKDTPTGLIGFSQGGWIVPLAALRTSQVKFMILWSGPLVTTLEQLRFQFLTGARAEFWDQHTEVEARQHIRSDPDRFAFQATDPADSLRRLAIPGLWLYGGRDVNVPVGLSIERLGSLAAGGRPFEHVLFPDSGHQRPENEALPALLSWLQRTIPAPQDRLSP